MVGQINHLANCQNEAVTEMLLFLLYGIVNAEAAPNDAIAYEEEGNNTGHNNIQGYIKHSVWPIPALCMHRSNPTMIECDRCILCG